jgi:magnesium transporter
MVTTQADGSIPPVEYGFGSAGDLATAAVLVATRDTRADEVGSMLAAVDHEVEDEIVICDGGRFEGLVPVERIIKAPAGTTLGRLASEPVPIVDPSARPERAAWQMVHHSDHVVAVVDEDGSFRGLIPASRIAEVLVREHETDLARLSGFLHDSASARLASTETIRRRLWHRLPWLLIGLAGAVLAAVVVGGFEAALEENVELAFFLPGIVYLADAVGTQTETLVVRGLSVGVSIRDVVGRETVTGLVLGVLLGAIALPVGALLIGSAEVALVVAVSLFAAAAIATVVAMVLPSLFHRLGVDPAFGSGPLATVVQDLLSIVIYFTVATLIL